MSRSRHLCVLWKSYRSVVFATFILLPTIVASPPQETPTWVSRELGRIEEARLNGGSVYVTMFSVHRLYSEALSEQAPRADRVGDYQTLIGAIRNAGITPIGASSAWIFPESSNPPLLAPSLPAQYAEEEVRLPCIPDDPNEYQRLLEIRRNLFGALAEAFPNVIQWILGYEANFEFYACDGHPLELPKLVTFFVDTLETLTPELRSARPGATVFSHFLGRSGFPIFVQGELVQPSELLAAMLSEIDKRGRPTSDYFDALATQLDPNLLRDRFPEDPTPVDLRLRSNRRASLRGISTRGGTPGWVVQFLENFGTAADDLVDEYSDWDDIDIDNVEVVAVASGKAELELGIEATVSSAGAQTTSSTNAVPDENFDSGVGERDKWTAVTDYYQVSTPADADNATHSAASIRVNSRYGGDDRITRFGAMGFPVKRNVDLCKSGTVGKPCGGVLFRGDDASKSTTTPKITIVEFPLSALPNNSSYMYRVQIMEREAFDPLNNVWEHQWTAEVWNLKTTPNDSTDDVRLGFSNWIWESTVDCFYGIEKPSLGSKYLFGYAPGDDTDGQINVDRTGTSYWNY